jgi:hypothetical protein
MFEVVDYAPPHIFVRSRRTGETYRFLVASDGTLPREETCFDQGDARRTAETYLFQKREAAVTM